MIVDLEAGRETRTARTFGAGSRVLHFSWDGEASCMWKGAEAEASMYNISRA